MSAISRRKSILSMLERGEMVKTTDMSEQLKVSVMTIRRDLNSLAEDGIITLTHGGGAVLNRGALFEHNMLYKQETLNDEKKRIGEFCARYVNEGDAVFIDTGSTALKVAEALTGNRNLLVVSHSLAVQQVLARSPGVKLISAPGVFREKTYGFLGQLTCEFVKSFRFDTLFLGVEGVDVEHGFMVPDITDGETKRALVKQANQVVVVADYTKIGISCFMTIVPLDGVDVLVTNENADPDVIAEIRKRGVTVHLV